MAMPSASATSADCIKLTSGASAGLRGRWVTIIEWWSRAPRPRDTISSVASHDSADCLMVIGDLVINYNFSRVYKGVGHGHGQLFSTTVRWPH